eukprot:symbB.v1.2.005308.t1/scaffold283.1/size308953/9
MRYILVSLLSFGVGLLAANIFNSKSIGSGSNSVRNLDAPKSLASSLRMATTAKQPGERMAVKLVEEPAELAVKLAEQPIQESAKNQEQKRPSQLRVEGDFLKRDGQEVIMDLPKVLKCDPLEHLLIINLEGEGGQARRDHIYQEFERGGLKGRFNFWPAVNFKTDERLATELGRRSCPCNAQVGCGMSHRRIYEMMLYEEWPCATIFEDDVGLATNFSERVAAVADSIPPFDVILWGYCPGGMKPRHESEDYSIPKVKFGWPGACVHAYTVSLSGAYALTRGNTPIHTPPDGAMDGFHHWDKSLRRYLDRSSGKLTGSYYYVQPMLAFQPVKSDNLGGGV